ncbi:recombinase family protein, partial [Alienimonas sp. DA493]|uniref:recombinase family protein n=1 Tax=Alienimonas sp. DA493 TaxID=3373605 RepID=UPI00375437B0
MLTAAAYYRMSDDRQTESIPAQVKAVAELAEQHGYRIVAEYRDDGISGGDAERPDWRRMLDDAERAGWAAILCWDSDRFARLDPIELAYHIKPLRDAGVVLHTVAQGRVDWSDMAGRIVWAVQQEAKHSYLSDLSRNVLRGMERSVLSGRWPGKPPYGYAIGPEGRLVPDANAEHVRLIFRLYVAGDSLRKVAATLNEAGVGSPSGRRWKLQGVRSVLGNDSYLGRTTWGKHCRGKFGRVGRGGGRRAGGKGRDLNPEPVVIERTHEPLVSAATFAAAAGRLAANRTRTTPHRDGGAFVLSGLVRCGDCGQKMVGVTLRKGAVPHYRCLGRNLDPANPKRHAGAYTVRQADILEKIEDRLREKQNLDVLVAELTGATGGEARRAERESAARRAKALRKKVEAASARILSLPESVVPDATAQLEKLIDLRDAAERRAATLAAEPEVCPVNADRIRAVLENVPRAIREAPRPLLRDALEEAFDSIDCHFRTERRPDGRVKRHVLSKVTLEADSVRVKSSGSARR